ncbi:MAG: molybdopterin cofactor-binding domain-containing protein [Synergistes jonesii]|uniref:molybdopterin-dependent oxidoreductase n=1 Tax=Synergistes jonesii TaxID=2754 RepID=UPI002A74CD88|nr:molybdopterin cofactor-binding domain-containing protein [Synergistes jonesii]MDY2984285.1 molybdopterin cofactor-binding domain-containing protein [Synergistes jonesii]
MSIRKGIFIINGAERVVMSEYDKDSLADVLRRIGLTSVKVGCGSGQCGTCTVLVNGDPVRACIKKFKDIPEHTRIETLEGIGTASHLHPLQQAWIACGGVQCGFCTPGFIMSSKGLLDNNLNPTRKEVRDWFTKHNNLCRCTGYKPLVDAVMAAAAIMRGEITERDLEFKMPVNGSIYHTRYPRPDALYKVLGVADYGNDIAIKMPPGTLHMAVTWAEHHHANILGIDTSEAEKAPGVIVVITHKDIQGTNNLGAPITSKMSIAKRVKQPVLAVDKVRRIGEAVAIVIADTEENARAAAKLVKVDYKVLPFYSNYLESCRDEAVSIDGEAPNDLLRQPVFKGTKAQEIFEKAENPNSGIYVVKGSFHSSRQPHLMLEPWSLQSYYDEDNMLTVNYKSQTLWAGMVSVPRAIGCSPKEFRIIEIPSGASFGASMDQQAVAMIAAAEMVVRRPITWTQTYAETQRFTGKRAASYTNIKLACGADGKILALDFDNAIDHGGNANSAGNLEKKIVRFIGYPYNIPQIRGLSRGGLSNQPHGVAYRAYGSPQCYTASEQIIDMMAEKLGMDPLEIRYINGAVEGDMTNNSYLFKNYGIREMIDKLRPYYEESLEWAKQPTEENWKRGIGVACGGYHVSTPADRSEVDIELMPDGSVTQYNCWEAMGQGSSIGTLAHMHEALKPLNLPIEKINLYQNDTKFCPPTGPASGSRSHYMAGNATILAANELMNAMRKQDGTYRTYDEMIAEGIPTKYHGVFSTVGLYKAIDDFTGVGDPTPDNNLLVITARVEVNVKTGKTRVLAIRGVADVGVVGNFLAVEGQAYGSMAHSIGFALTEDYHDEVKKNDSPLGCGFLRCNDIPDDMEFQFQETHRKTGPHGSGGASECFQSCGHVAVLNAINNAVGVRIYEIPATPKKILSALKAKAEGRDYAPESYFFGENYNDILDYAKERAEEEQRRELSTEEIEEEIRSGGH